ncbi:MAG TPA: hypothetical protein PKE66_14935, partial [Pyrinomonadaceae bacterium]|nr:hypothetical protein [Pyrinomonadaceae bacterium]
RMQLGEDVGNIQAEISAGLNIQNGTITWTLTAVDPQTNERPLSPLVGLLPPNNEDRDGEGFVTFTVQPKATQVTGTEIANFATIFFDENEPIVTNATSNTLDADIPTSSVAALPATLDTPEISLSWDGFDAAGGSGVKGVDIFFSENGGPYQPLLNAEGPGSAVFLGNWGRTYRFFSVASDNAGNIEAAPATPDAVVSILGGATESDLAPRPNGNNDGTVSIADLTQVRRFVSGLDSDFQYNEFQRSDTAPLSSSGDGVLSVGDIVQARRYVAGLDDVKNAAGPNAAIEGASVKTVAGRESAMGTREVRPVRLTRVGDQIGVAIEIAAQGDEVAVGFTLNFDPQVISNPANISLGSGASGMSLTVNSSQAAAGRLGIVLDKDPTQPLPAGTQQLVTMTFTVAPTNPASALIGFGNSPVRREAVNGLAESLSVTFTDTAVSLLAPTSAPATLAGRVTDASG